VGREVESARAEAAEAAPLAALSLAAREVGPGGAVAVVDSGLQTVDPIDFRQGFFTASPTEISNWLEVNHLLPDLKDRTLLLAGVGDTAEPQPGLNEALHADLVAIWQQIAKVAGASCISIVTAPAVGAVLSGLPPVSVVSLPQTPSLRLSCQPSSFTTASTIGFVANSATFQDVVAAQTTLRDLAEEIRTKNRPVTIAGTTETYGTTEQQARLSLARAQTVESELRMFGVPENLMTVRGVGTNFAGFVKDVDEAGHLNPALAATNRSVIIQEDC
jgi:outer membrane protein OmpA-like peptidoglycan-associated protein